MYLFRKSSLFKIIAFAFCAWYFFACTVVKEYQPNKPFVFANKVIVEATTISKDEKIRLETELDKYWDDSLKVNRLKKFGVKTIVKKPPVFDTMNLARTKKFMNAYLNSQGYYYAIIKDSLPLKIDTVKDEYRAKPIIKIALGKNITIDTVSYAFTDTSHKTNKDTILQNLAMQQYANTLLKKGKPYTKQIVANELDNLVTWFRQNGYYKFNRDYVYALVDTTNEKLFKLTLDPIELAKLIAEAEKQKRENPTWDITIKQRITTDTNHLTKFFIGKTFFYPETDIKDYPDSLIKEKWNDVISKNDSDLVVRTKKGLFKLRPLKDNSFLRKGNIYNEDLHLKTVNTLSKIVAWQQIDARIVERGKDTLDLHYFLVPQAKYVYNYNLTGSRNSGDFAAGNLLGLSLNANVTNRNVWKQAIQSNTTLSAGVELNLARNVGTGNTGDDLIQTVQFNVGHTYIFPRLSKSLNAIKIFSNADAKRTFVALNAAYTERIETFRVRSFNINYGWEWQKKNKTFYTKPINIELYSIDTLPGLVEIFKKNPFLRNSFFNGNVLGLGPWNAGVTITNAALKKPNSSYMLRFGVDESGLLLSPISSLDDKIYKYIKLEAELKYNAKFKKSEFAYHFFGGLGLPLAGQSLPFFKQYFAGGPNSMRAWGLRQLGLGSSKLSDTISLSAFRDRFGDMQLEANLEYRFLLANISSFKITSALFADIGNIWNLKKNSLDANAEFSFKRFTKDIAIGVGTGLRLDFSYFLIRLDFAYKVKDPGREDNNGWMSIKNFKWKEERNNASKTEIRNYAFQLGIGLPF